MLANNIFSDHRSYFFAGVFNLFMIFIFACKPATPSQPPANDSPTSVAAPQTDTPAPEVMETPEGSQPEISPSSSENSTSIEPIAGNIPSLPQKPPLQLPPPLFPHKNSACGKDPGVNSKAIAFTLPTPTGEQLSLRQYRRRIVLLNFWGTWCKPCLKELPEFARLYRHYQKYGLTLIAVATDSDGEEVMKFLKQRKLMAKVAIQGEELANQYNSPTFPFSFVIDRENVIRASYRGYRPECLGQLEQDIRIQLQALLKN